MWRDKIQMSRKCGKPVSKTRQHEHRQCWAWSSVIDTHNFSRLEDNFILFLPCLRVEDILNSFLPC